MTNMNYSQLENEIRLLKEFTQSKINNETYSQSNRMRLAHDLDDILISCSFNGINCKNDLIPKFEKRYGNCFVFNGGKNSTQYPHDLKLSVFEGSDYGLKLVLYVNHYEKLSKFNSINALGAKIHIENSSYLNDNQVTGIR